MITCRVYSMTEVLRTTHHCICNNDLCVHVGPLRHGHIIHSLYGVVIEKTIYVELRRQLQKGPVQLILCDRFA